MSKQSYHDFGIIEENYDAFEFHYDSGDSEKCQLELVIQMTRGPERTKMATISATLWSKIRVRVIRELVASMGEEERTRKTPSIKLGANRLGILLGREIAVLFWALNEDSENLRVDRILYGWRELAREERWWLYTKATAPGQHTGLGWRRAIFLALSEPFESSSFEPSETKESSMNVASTKDRFPVENGQSATGTKLNRNHEVCGSYSEPNQNKNKESIRKENSEVQVGKNSKKSDSRDLLQMELF